MRNPKTLTYAFHPTQRTIDFTGTPGFDVRNLAGVLHPSGALIYFPGKAGLGLDLLRTTGAVVALQYNTASFGASDPLVILYEDGTAPLPADAARESKQDAQSALLVAIRDALQAQRSETIWTDDGGARYVRIDKGGAISWTDISGNASAAPGAGARPDSDSGTVVTHETYRATAAGTGYAANDLLDHVIVTDGDAGDLVSNFWINVLSGAKIGAPPAANITLLSPLPDGAATAVNQAAVIAGLTSVAAGIGAPGDAAPANDAAASGAIGLLRRALGYLSALAATVSAGALSAFTPPVEASGALSSSGDAVTVLCTGRNTVMVSLPNGSWTGSAVIEGTGVGDYSDAVALTALPFGGPGAATITGPGVYEATVTGLKAVRVRATSAITGGPITALVRSAIGNRSVRVRTPATDPLPVTGNLTTSAAVATTDAPYTIGAGANLPTLAASATRAFLEVTNTGPNPLAIRFGSPASATNGRVIAPGQTATYSGAVPNGALNIFSTAGTTAFVTVS